jgi:hypothetical protein
LTEYLPYQLYFGQSSEGQSSPLSFTDTVIAHFSCPREEFSVFVETDSHDSVGRVESFFDTITVVDIDIDVYDSLVISASQPVPTKKWRDIP